MESGACVFTSTEARVHGGISRNGVTAQHCQVHQAVINANIGAHESSPDESLRSFVSHEQQKTEIRLLETEPKATFLPVSAPTAVAINSSRIAVPGFLYLAFYQSQESGCGTSSSCAAILNLYCACRCRVAQPC